MASMSKKPHKNGKSNPHSKTLKRKRDEEDLDALDGRVRELDPRGNQYDTFAKLPLSQPTASGLEASHFKTLTDIQKQAIPFGLRGFDILGAAKTGSGKTLAFLVPVLENLYRRRWTELDGLGALILSPTRELAIQIFEVLRKIGRYHTFSAGLVIGGKSLQEERDRMGRMNILVCTPGRMLQHLDQTSTFEVGNLQVLVLDEADRIMDMGFQTTVDAIIEHVPKQRQTLLFSATQTKKVSDLARLSLRDPEYVSVHHGAKSATPATLQQNYIVTALPDKLDTLWSFIRANLKSKILVFLSSGKQVRFVYEAFRHMQPGIPLMHLHGRQKQTARLDITDKFSSSKNSCLFATDVVARGLDFPAVDWVIQLDCPEDADTYIHRVGRTARYEREGRTVLFLDPTEEEGMLKRLSDKRVTVEKINVRQKKQQSIKNQLQSMCFKDSELKYLGQKAFVSYIRSVHVQKDKRIFKLDQLPLEEFAASLGLPGAPKIKFGKGENMKLLKNAPRAAAASSLESEGEADSLEASKSRPTKEDQIRTKYDRMFGRKNQDILADHYTKLIDDGIGSNERNVDDEDGETGFMNTRRMLSDASDDGEESADSGAEVTNGRRQVVTGIKDPLLIDSKRREKLLKSKKKLLKFRERGKKLVYDEDGNAHEIYELEDEEKFKSRGTADTQKQKFLEAEKQRLQGDDAADKALAKAKRKNKRDKRKTREKAEGEGGDEDAGVQLAPLDDAGESSRSEQSKAEEEKEGKSPEPAKKKQKIRFDIATAESIRREGRGVQGSESLEDLEAMATGLLP